ncbi:MAG: antibiotic biosynthesis monooxygenase [Paracoccaceae bacterium]
MAIHLTGKLICNDEAQAAIVRAHLSEHIRLTHAEPGCERFEVEPESPLVWSVRERFSDRAAFDAHQSRVKASAWGQATQGIPREYQITED